MRLKLLSVGRERADPAAPLVADYISRISKFVPVEDVVLRPDRQDRVAARMLKNAGKRQILVALDGAGEELDSFAFSEKLASWMSRADSVSFLIGGAEGLPQEVRDEADVVLALSKMTLPHRLARLLLAEQIYRALCISRRVPYQK